MENLQNILLSISGLDVITALLLVIVGIVHFAALSQAMRALWAFFFLGFVFGAVELAMYMMKLGINNLFIAHFFTFGEFLCISGAAYYWCQNAKTRNVIKLIAAVYIALWIIAKFTIEPMDEYDTYTASLGMTVLILFIGLLQIQYAGSTTFPSADSLAMKTTLFYLTGNVLYLSMTAFFPVLGQEAVLPLYGVHICVNVAVNVSYLLALLRAGRAEKVVDASLGRAIF